MQKSSNSFLLTCLFTFLKVNPTGVFQMRWFGFTAWGRFFVGRNKSSIRVPVKTIVSKCIGTGSYETAVRIFVLQCFPCT